MKEEQMGVYVGTYKKYANGNLSGKWLRLLDYKDYDEFIEACRKLHSDEKDPEFMFQDFMNIPYCLGGESYLEDSLFDYAKQIEESKTIDASVFCEFINHEGKMDDAVSVCEESFLSDEDFEDVLRNAAEQYLEDLIGSNFSAVYSYLNFEAAKDIFRNNYYFKTSHFVFKKPEPSL